jgi:hypothetical protein
VNRRIDASCHPTVAGSSRLAEASVVTPSDTNGAFNRAPSPMKTMSQWGRIVSPMPTPTPLTAASSGFGNDSSTGISWR